MRGGLSPHDADLFFSLVRFVRNLTEKAMESLSELRNSYHHDELPDPFARDRRNNGKKE